MKKYLILPAMAILFILPLSGQVYRTVNIVVPGTLTDSLDAMEKATITHLTVTGTIDSMDFTTMRNSMSVLSVIDMGGCSVNGNAIPVDAFINKTTLTAIVLPPDITAIRQYAFEGSGIRTINIPSPVTFIGIYAFMGCDSLSAITVSESNTAYSSTDGVLFDKAQSALILYPNTRPGSYTIPATVTSIEKRAFYKCSGITSVYIPSSVALIDIYAFMDCKNLTHFMVDEANTSFCSLEGVLFSKDLTELMQFPIKKPADNYTIPSSVVSINRAAFFGCTGLTSILIPPSVKTISYYAFASCRSLTSIKIPASVEKILNMGFRDCSGLTSVEIPPSVNLIGVWSFEDCTGLIKATIPSSLEEMGTNAFSGCSNLDTIQLNSVVPMVLDPLEVYFRNVDTLNCVLLVPTGSLSTYQAAVHWRSFENIMQFDFGLVTSESSLAIGATNGSTASFTITSNTEWRIEADQAWLQVSDTLGMNNGPITLTADANTSVAERSATITVTGLGTDPAVITVTQAAGPTGLQEADRDAFTIWPNPVGETLFIRGAKGNELVISSLEGKIICTRVLDSDSENIDMKPMLSGVYIIRIGDRTMKIVK
ncbi:MAG: leucine-rich repeat protein [Bacteroidales bacterium]|nr:leucine-rich repeat protein [Bacteroidales bacterium]